MKYVLVFNKCKQNNLYLETQIKYYIIHYMIKKWVNYLFSKITKLDMDGLLVYCILYSV